MEQFSDVTSELDSYMEVLDRATFDPVLKAIVEDAKLYNELIREQKLSDESDEEQLIGIMHELNERWMKVMGATVFVTGDLERYQASPSTQLVQRKANRDELITHGFTYTCYEEHPRLLYAFVEEVIDEDGDRAVVPWYADFDKVHLDLVSAMSKDRAEAILTITCPELLQQIDGQLFNIPRGEPLVDAELMALRRLGEVRHELSNGDDVGLISKAAQVYANTRLGFDDVVPYNLSYDGVAGMPDGDGDYNAIHVKIQNAFAVAPHLYFVEDTASGEDASSLGFMLNVHYFVGSDRENPGVDAMLSPGSLLDFMPYRG